MHYRSRLMMALLFGASISGCQQEPPEAAKTEESAVADQPSPAQPRVVDLMPSHPPVQTPSMENGVAIGRVLETIAAAGYTYVQVDVGEQQIWAAGPPTALKPGDMIRFSTVIPMKDFFSKAMNRSFPVLYFADSFSKVGSALQSQAPVPVAAAANSDTSTAAIEKVAGGYTIAEALSQKSALAGKPIKVRGKVIKVSPGIMGKNWLHIVDGSGTEKLIVTTDAMAGLGAIIVAEGALGLDRDFGYGYHYDVLMENAQVIIE